MKKVLLSFIQYPSSEKLSYYRNVVSKTSGNAVFSTTEISFAELTTALDQFEAAIVAARDGSHTATSVLHDTEFATDKKFRILASFVDKIADGDETIILSAGLQATKDAGARTKPPLTATHGTNSGNVKLSAKAKDKAGAYIFRSAKGTGPFVASDWVIIAIVTQASYEVTGLIKGEFYNFDFAAVTPTGTTDFCAPVEILVT